MRCLSPFSVITIIASIASVASGATYPPGEAARLAEIALARNPEAASARLDAEAAHALARHHRGWEAPEIAVDFFQAPVSAFPNPVKKQDEIDYSVSQRFPFPGKLRGMAEPEHRRGRAADMRAEAVALDLRHAVFDAYADLYEAEWGLRLARGNRADVEALLGETRRGYASGRGGASTLPRLEAELARLDMAIAEREGKRREAAVMLSTLLADSGSALRLDSLALPDPVAADARVENQPDLASARLELEAARSEVAAARRELYPDFMVRGMYKDMLGATPDDWSLMVGMTIPFAPWAKPGVDEGARRARALEAKAGRDLDAARLRAVAEVGAAEAMLEATTRRAALARDRLEPAARASLDAAREDYATGSVPFAEVIEALREVRRAREEYHRAAADALKAWAALERAKGGTIRVAAEETGS